MALRCEHRTIPDSAVEAASRTSICWIMGVNGGAPGPEKTSHLGVLEEVAKLLHELADDLVIQQEKVVEVEHCG